MGCIIYDNDNEIICYSMYHDQEVDRKKKQQRKRQKQQPKKQQQEAADIAVPAFRLESMNLAAAGEDESKLLSSEQHESSSSTQRVSHVAQRASHEDEEGDQAKDLKNEEVISNQPEAGSAGGKSRQTKGHGRPKNVVQHDYHDYSAPGSEVPYQKVERKSRGGNTPPSQIFPRVLFTMLEAAERDGYSHIVSWQSHGRAFSVYDQPAFVAEVMPLYFRQTRFSSFQRQLSLYGFLRLVRKGPDQGAYYHELFLRGMPHLIDRMHRTRVKGYWVRQSSSPETEPDFYQMPSVGVGVADPPAIQAASAATAATVYSGASSLDERHAASVADMQPQQQILPLVAAFAQQQQKQQQGQQGQGQTELIPPATLPPYNMIFPPSLSAVLPAPSDETGFMRIQSIPQLEEQTHPAIRNFQAQQQRQVENLAGQHQAAACPLPPIPEEDRKPAARVSGVKPLRVDVVNQQRPAEMNRYSAAAAAAFEDEEDDRDMAEFLSDVDFSDDEAEGEDRR